MFHNQAKKTKLGEKFEFWKTIFKPILANLVGKSDLNQGRHFSKNILSGICSTLSKVWLICKILKDILIFVDTNHQSRLEKTKFWSFRAHFRKHFFFKFSFFSKRRKRKKKYRKLNIGVHICCTGQRPWVQCFSYNFQALDFQHLKTVSY